MPAPFRNVGSYYENFEHVSDAEVSSLLEACTPAPRHAMHLR
jgi:predicted phosphoribosyltransferase